LIVCLPVLIGHDLGLCRFEGSQTGYILLQDHRVEITAEVGQKTR
jgi:hypothetical protein